MEYGGRICTDHEVEVDGKSRKLKLATTTGCFAPIILLALALCLSVHSFAQDVGKTRKRETQSLSRTTGTPRYQLLNINNITTWMRSDGQSNHSPTGGDGTLFPRGTSWVIYQDGIIWGGKAYLDSLYTTPHPAQVIRVGGQTYNIGTQSGWVIGEGANAVAASQTDPAVRIYRIRRDYARMPAAELRRDAAEYFETVIGAVTTEQMEQIRTQYETDWNEWPVEHGAPYIERNRIPGYQEPPPFSSAFGPDDLISGNFDEPGMAGQDPHLPADQVVWTVYNDLNRDVTITLFGSEPVGLEVQVTLWAYKRNTAIDNSYFRRVRLINKGGVDVGGGQRNFLWIDSMFIAQWSDPDVGAFGDDLAGCDTLLSMGFVYNGNDRDREFDQFNLPPPAIGYDFLQGPIIGGMPDDTAVVDFQKRAGSRNLPLLAFTYTAPGVFEEPFTYEGALRWWRQLQGYQRTPSTSPVQLYPHPPGVTPGRFPLSGEPVTGTGFIDGLGTNYSLPMGDRRIALSAGPIRLAPRDTQEIVVAVIGGIGADRLSSIAVMKFNDRYVQNAYDRLLALPKAPVDPRVHVAALDEEIILEWGSDYARVQETEDLTPPSGYAFEGYNVYQLRSSTSSKDDGVKIATFDRMNGLRYIYDELPDPVTGIPIPTLVQLGNDTGIKRHIRITHDALHGGRLRNGTEYYFAVTSYNHSPDPNAIPRSLESEPRVLGVKPRIPFGVQPATKFGDTLRVDHVQGRSDGEVIPIVIDPLLGTGHNYEVRFDTANGVTTWYVRNATTNAVVVAEQPHLGDEEGFLNIEGGILLKVAGPPMGMKDWEIPSGVRRFSFADANMGFEGFEGSIGWNEPAFFFGNIPDRTVKAHETRTVLLKLADATSGLSGNGTNLYGGWDENNPGSDPNFSYAYRYLRGATDPPARVEFAPYIVNPSQGFAYQDYKRGVPLSAWNVEVDPPVRLAVGHLENNIATGLVDGKWWPPANGTGQLNDTSLSGPHEWLFVLDRPYTGDTPDPALQVDLLNERIPVMWWLSVTRRGGSNFFAGDEFLILSNHPNTVNDIFSYTSIAPESSDALRKASARHVGVFPNPYYAGQTDGAVMHGRFITFNNLPPKAIIRIYNLAGHLVRTLRKDEPSQFSVWDLKNENGWLIASGMYLCHVEMHEIGETKILKLAVIQDVVIPPVR